MRSTTVAALRRCSCALALFCFGTLVLAQSRPVTLGEANAVFDKVDASIRRVLKLAPARASADSASRAVTRAEVVSRLDALFEVYRPKFAYTPRPFRSEPEAVAKTNKDARTIASLNKLVRWGCVAPVGPLATGPAETLTVQQFGDAVGYFMSQIAALTYYADPAWTPSIQPPQ